MTGVLEKWLSAIPRLARLRITVRFDQPDVRAPEPPPSLPAVRPPSPAVPATGAETHVEIISLAALRTRHRHAWPKIEEKVHTVVRAIIGHYLGQGDHSWQDVPCQYVVRFMQMSAPEASRRAADIRRDIETVFGPDKTRSGEEAWWCHGIARAPGADSWFSSPQGAEPRESRARQRSVNAPRPDQQPGKGMPLFFRAGTYMSLFSPRRCRPPLRRDENGKGIFPEPVRFAIQPVWDAEARKAGVLRCNAMHTAPDGATFLEYDAIPEDADDAMYLEMDLALLKTTACCLAKTPARMTVLCPVHYKTLAHERLRHAYLVAARAEIPSELQDRLWFEIMHMPRALPPGSLFVAIWALRTISPCVFVSAAFEPACDLALADAGATGVSVDLAPLRAFSAKLFERRMRKFVHAANGLKLRTLAKGLHTGDWICGARASGFSYLCGEGVKELMTENPEKLLESQGPVAPGMQFRAHHDDRCESQSQNIGA